MATLRNIAITILKQLNTSMTMVAGIRSNTGLKSVFMDTNEFVCKELLVSGDLDPLTYIF
ncbi:hypothetical protein GCM10010525_04750 [Glutamicibacter bergerei]